MLRPILLIGGYGKTGEKVARQIRRRHPDQPLVIGGRSLAKADALAGQLGNATSTLINLDDPALETPEQEYGAIALFAHDPSSNAMNFAARQRTAFLLITGGAFEFGVDAIPGLQAGRFAPIVYAGYWYAGAVTMAALHLAQRFKSVESITIGIVIDTGDGAQGAGPATIADFKRISANAPSVIQRIGGRYTWVPAAEARGAFDRADGISVQGAGSVACDVISIGAVTGAQDIRVLEGWGVSSSRAKGGPPCDEINIEIKGVGIEGRPFVARQSTVFPRGQSSFTAASSLILIERLSGIDGDAPPAPGFYMGEHIVQPEMFMSRLTEEGAILNAPTELC